MANVLVFGAELNWWRQTARGARGGAGRARLARQSARGAGAVRVRPSSRCRARRRSAPRRRGRRSGRSRSPRCRAARATIGPRACRCREAPRLPAKRDELADVARAAVARRRSAPRAAGRRDRRRRSARTGRPGGRRGRRPRSPSPRRSPRRRRRAAPEPRLAARVLVVRLARPPADSRRRRAARSPSPASAARSSRSLPAFFEQSRAIIGPANALHVLELGRAFATFSLHLLGEVQGQRDDRGRSGSSSSWKCATVRSRRSSASSTALALLAGRRRVSARRGRIRVQHPVRGDAQRPQRDERAMVPMNAARVVAGAGAMPIAAASQSVAAVVRPRTVRPWRMIAPAPRKPMPVTICAAIRVGSKTIPSRWEEARRTTRTRRRGEERGAERDEQVRAKPRFALAQLALEADRTAERGRDEQPDQATSRSERESSGKRRPPVPARSPRSPRPRDRAARRATRA